MSTMFALVITVEKECQEAAVEQGVKGECLPLKGVLAEHPAGFTAQM